MRNRISEFDVQTEEFSTPSYDFLETSTIFLMREFINISRERALNIVAQYVSEYNGWLSGEAITFFDEFNFDFSDINIDFENYRNEFANPSYNFLTQAVKFSSMENNDAFIIVSEYVSKYNGWLSGEAVFFFFEYNFDFSHINIDFENYRNEFASPNYDFLSQYAKILLIKNPTTKPKKIFDIIAKYITKYNGWINREAIQFFDMIDYEKFNIRKEDEFDFDFTSLNLNETILKKFDHEFKTANEFFLEECLFFLKKVCSKDDDQALTIISEYLSKNDGWDSGDTFSFFMEHDFDFNTPGLYDGDEYLILYACKKQNFHLIRTFVTHGAKLDTGCIEKLLYGNTYDDIKKDVSSILVYLLENNVRPVRPLVKTFSKNSSRDEIELLRLHRNVRFILHEYGLI